VESDQTATARLVLQAQLELQRVGLDKAMALLESTEPDLTEYLLASTTNLHKEMLNTGATGKQARRIHDRTLTLVLVCLNALKKGHAALWQDGTGQDVARRLDPPAAQPPSPTPPVGP
jgi:hypothetical protein